MCRNARRIADLCEFLGQYGHFEDSEIGSSTRLDLEEASHELRELLLRFHGGRHARTDALLDVLHGEALYVGDHDPDTDPYIWD